MLGHVVFGSRWCTGQVTGGVCGACSAIIAPCQGEHDWANLSDIDGKRRSHTVAICRACSITIID